jgi:hypothetical protein
VNTQGRDERYIQDFFRKPKGKILLGRPSNRWEDLRKWVLKGEVEGCRL